MSEHIVSLKTNVFVWLTLLVSTGVTSGAPIHRPGTI